ncbi:hypothetical protein EUX98_g1074 [Antrodiella citrinella]|uniref:Uncharacterized protein n=1 Tax=Antrodiella citrinella TaxID=2447956 RepID=A0A4S4N5I6_9APHY|nr:hypothetical protein EUX98_g1074 [Antrodiella citrinella]
MPPPSTVPSRSLHVPDIQETGPPPSSQDTSSMRSSRPPSIPTIQPTRKAPSIASSSNSIPPSVPSTQQSNAPPAQQKNLPEPAGPALSIVDDPSPASLAKPSQEPPPASSTVAEDVPPPEAFSLDNSQIDPALLEAVVTALQHAEQSAASDQTDTINASISLPQEPPQDSVQSTSEAGGSVAAVVAPKARWKRTKRATGQSEGDAEAENGASEETTPKPKKARKRKRTDSAGASQTENDEDGEDFIPRKRKSSGGRKAKPVAVYDTAADPGEEIDPTSVLMGTLCDDQGTGRISSKAAQIVSNHAAWRVQNREKRARMRAMQEAKKYGRNLDEEEDNAASAQAAAKESSTPSPEDALAAPSAGPGSPVPGPSSTHHDSDDERPPGDRFDYSQSMATSRYNVQVRIGPNGETIIDEDSLFVDTNEEDDTTAYTHVEESDATKFINSATYSKKSRGSRWSAEETELFYDALSQFGENYELISFILPGRDRKACKNKFKAEDKRDPNRITFCLTNKRPYDIETLSRMTGKDFSGPTPVIRTPTPSIPAEATTNDADAAPNTSTTTRTKPASKRKKAAQAASADEEILGNLSDLEDDATDLAITQGLSF